MTDRPPHGAIPELPADLPLVERDVVRVVVLDVKGDLLLLHAQDGTDPSVGTWWELPGGGIEAGETVARTAARELAEETGIVAEPAAFTAPAWRRDASFRYRGRRHLQHEVVVLLRVAATAPPLDVSGRTHYEAEDYPEYRWWSPAAVAASAERFYPTRLPALLPVLLAGGQIDEPFELFN